MANPAVSPDPPASSDDPVSRDDAVQHSRSTALNEDWLATIAGLVLLVLVLTGLLPGWLVP